MPSTAAIPLAHRHRMSTIIERIAHHSMRQFTFTFACASLQYSMRIAFTLYSLRIQPYGIRRQLLGFEKTARCCAVILPPRSPPPASQPTAQSAARIALIPTEL